MNKFAFLKGVLVMLMSMTPAYASSIGSTPDPISSILFWVTLLFILAVIGRFSAKALHLPGVVGELLIGIFFGNVFYYFDLHLAVILREGETIFDIMKDLLHGANLHQAVHHHLISSYYADKVGHALQSRQGYDNLKVAYIIDIFSRYGVIFLLFMVGLESSIQELRKTGRASLVVALIGVIVPMGLGIMVMYLLAPHSSYKTNLFIAATLAATSIGITARVLKELKQLHSREAKTVLGAAMIDDILGLLILSVVSGLVINQTVDILSILSIVSYTVIYFLIALLLGPWFIRKLSSSLFFIEMGERKLIISFAFVMLLSWAATLIHLSSIIGAFAAGIIIHDGMFEDGSSKQNQLAIKELLGPFEAILSPLFFMLIGIQVKLETFFHTDVLLLAAGLIVAAILGKLLSGFGANKRDDRLLVGIAMIPRGEVGLIFASIGMSLGVISDQIFSSIVFVVIVTTIIAPVWLKLRFQRQVHPHD